MASSSTETVYCTWVGLLVPKYRYSPLEPVPKGFKMARGDPMV